MLVHSHGFPCGHMVQRDGTDTPNRVHIIMYIIVHANTFPRIPMWSHGTVGWDRHSGQSTYMYIYSTCQYIPRIPTWSHGTAGWDRHSGQSTYMYKYSTYQYIPKDSHVVLWYSGMGQTLWKSRVHTMSCK